MRSIRNAAKVYASIHRTTVAFAVLLAGMTLAQAQPRTSVTLSAYTSGAFRWKDVAGNLYSAAYRESYSYTQATVVITYYNRGDALRGTLSATNLKPHFAYQLKLSGLPEVDVRSNENLGFSGRWWKQDWNGTAWSSGWNLNDKGTGYSPTPNDLAYLSMRDIEDATSPTGRKHRFSGYRPFDYFITDADGNATLEFAVRSSYHVLWKTSQRTPVAGDGPVKTHAFEPQSGDLGYDAEHFPASVGVFGEWERLPADSIPLTPGSYSLEFLLTEESFHDSGLGGWWAHAAHGPAQFMILSAEQHATLITVR